MMGMLEQLVITLREGVEAALIVAIAITYLRKIGRPDLIRTVYAALTTAVAVSLAGAIAMTLAHWNEDRFEGWLMLAAAIFVFTMVVWMHRAARFLRQDIEHRISALGGGASRWGLFLFIFFMVLREGVETVLMLSAVSLNSTELSAWLGSVAGLVLAVVFAVAFVRGSMRIHLPRFFRITTAILLVIGAQLLLTGAHELMESGVVPSSTREMAIVGPIVANDAFFFIVILGLAGLMILRERYTAASHSVAVGAAAGSAAPSLAERRKAASLARSDRRWSLAASAIAFVFLLLIGADYVYARSAQALSPAETVTATAGWVALPVSQVADGSLHRYQVITPAGPVRFFAIRRPDGSIAVALDACAVCGAKGYYQRGAQLFCRNCDAPINVASIGATGGCNPIPLTAARRGSVVAIQLAALTAEAPRFK